MALTSTLLLLSVLLPSQNVPPELRRQRTTALDPILPEALRETAALASAAELDPKRGIGNAIQILRAYQNELPEKSPDRFSADLRIAATVLRSRFLVNEKLPIEARHQQALSTYSRLDLTEPGLRTWLERTLDANPAARRTLQKKRTLAVTFLTRGSGLAPDTLRDRFSAEFEPLGFKLERVPMGSAAYVLKVLADEARGENGRPTVRVTLELSEREGPFRQTLFRTSEAGAFAEALNSSLDWLIRIGGRDLLFHHLSENGLPGVHIDVPGGSGGHAHDHSTVRLPRGRSAEPPPPPRAE